MTREEFLINIRKHTSLNSSEQYVLYKRYNTLMLRTEALQSAANSFSLLTRLIESGKVNMPRVAQHPDKYVVLIWESSEDEFISMKFFEDDVLIVNVKGINMLTNRITMKEFNNVKFSDMKNMLKGLSLLSDTDKLIYEL